MKTRVYGVKKIFFYSFLDLHDPALSQHAFIKALELNPQVGFFKKCLINTLATGSKVKSRRLSLVLKIYIISALCIHDFLFSFLNLTP